MRRLGPLGRTGESHFQLGSLVSIFAINHRPWEAPLVHEWEARDHLLEGAQSGLATVKSEGMLGEVTTEIFDRRSHIHASQEGLQTTPIAFDANGGKAVAVGPLSDRMVEPDMSESEPT